MAAEDRNGEVVTEGECTGCTTQERSLDALARGLANGTVSRRKALWMLGGALMGSALGFAPRAASAEKCKPLAHKCTANIQCCSRRCDKQGQICVCPPQTQIACKGPTGQAKCINICHDPANPCETSLCDPTTGKCVVRKLTGTPCSDSNPCTLGDTCQNGTCQPGPIRTCGQCLKCNPATGTCEPDANQVGKPCNDSNACTTNDQCTVAGVCAGGELVVCDDNNPCTIDTCNPATGCVHTNVANGAPCETGNLCTADTCQNGQCTQGSIDVTCGQCLRCDPDTGTCVADPDQVGDPCNDENACTTNERCTEGGTCVGEPVACDDNNPCTIDTCNPTTGCVHTNVSNDTPCDDGNPCTIADTCQNGICQPGQPLECGQCLTCEGGVCMPDATQNGRPCDDDNPCTTNDTCQSGLCIGTPIPGCVVCATPADCPVPANPCLQATCVSRVCGVTPKPNGTQCDDENACTRNETCQSGVCIGEPVACDDNNPCTIDTCDPTTGCVHTNVANGAPCETGNLCTNDTCQNGTCTQGPVNVSCGQCLRCNPATGTCVPDLTKNGTSCNDGNACTTGETCQNGVCAGGTLKSCSACQQCNPVTGNCDRVTGTPCGAQGSGRTCCVGTCCQSTEICCSTGPFAGQCKKASGQFCSNNNNCCSQNCSGGICL